MNPPHPTGTASDTVAPSALPAALSSTPNALSLAKALRRRWLMAMSLGSVLAAIAGAAAIYLVPPPKHTARTAIKVPPGSPFLFKTAEAVPNILDHQRNQVAAVKSRLVLNSALKQPKVSELETIRAQPEPLEWLEKELQADFTVAPEVLKISISGDNPTDLVAIVDAVREAYRKEVLEKERSARQARLSWITERREKFETQLRTRREEQRSLEQKAGAKDPGSRGMIQAFMQQQLNWAERELLETQSDLRRARLTLAQAQAGVKPGDKNVEVPGAVVEDLLDNEPAVRDAKKAVTDLEELIAATIPVAPDGENSTRVIRLKEHRKAAESALAEIRKSRMPALAKETREKVRQGAALSVSQLTGRVQLLEENERVLLQHTEQIRGRIQDMAKNFISLDAFKEDMTQWEDLTKRITAEEEALRLELQAPDRTDIFEEGYASRMSDSKRAAMVGGMAAGAALLLTCLAIGLLEFRARRIGTPDELVHGLGLNLVGTIPDSSGRRAGDGAEGHDILTEAIDSTRTMLLQQARVRTLRVIMVTSAQSGEGKTTLATQLAASLAQVGYRTLLIDADLRSPIAHRVFELPAAPGFCELLRGEAALADVVRATPVDRLAMVPAGRWDSGATRALAQETLGRTLVGLREQYDFVIIDSSPVLPVVDPLLIGPHADGTLLSVLRDVSRMPTVYAAHKRLTAGGVQVIGAVINGVRGSAYGAAYPYRPRGLDEDPADAGPGQPA
jgi:capsular exopolysaccharide synthesis family protein